MADFILNGQASGSVGARLLEANGDVGALRPWRGKDGRSYVTLNEGGKPRNIVTNAAATLTREAWKQIDEVVVKAARSRLRAVAELRSRGLQYVIPNGMGKTALESSKQSDIGNATSSMDGLAKSERDRPHFDLALIPLPITHYDFHFALRELLASKNGGGALDMAGAELAGRKVAEGVEKLLLGNAADMTFGALTLNGFTNFADRNTKTLTAPTATGWTPKTFVNEVLDMVQKAYNDKHFGSYALFVAPAWDQYLNRDYSDNYPGITLRRRVEEISGIDVVATADLLTGNAAILVQLTQDVARMVIGQDVTVVQWETEGGMKINFKVLTIQVPQVRSDFAGNCGIVHGS